MTEIKNFIAYSRVSTQRQKYDETIQIQKDKLRMYDQEHPEIRIIETLEDDGISGLKDESGRPAYRTLKEMVKSPDIKGIICASLDRLGRSNLELQKLFEEIIKKEGKTLLLLSHNLDTSTKEGKFAFDVLSAQVEYDVRNTQERLKTGWNRAYNENPEKFGRPRKEVPEKLKNKIIFWYKNQKEGFHRISKLILSENIKEYPDWFQREYITFGKPTKEEKEELKKNKQKKFYLSPTLIGKLLKEWNISIREPKYNPSEQIKKAINLEVEKRIEKIKNEILKDIN